MHLTRVIVTAYYLFCFVVEGRVSNRLYVLNTIHKKNDGYDNTILKLS